MAVLCSILLLFGTMSVFGLDPASAAEFDDGSGYADAFIGGQGWKSDLITDLEPDADAGEHGEGLISGINAFCLNLGTIIIALSLFFCVFRFAARGVYQMVSQGNDAAKKKSKDEQSGLWRLIMTAQERDNDIMKDEWFVDMFKETMLFLAIGICAGFLVILIAAITSFAMGQLTGQASDAGYGTFNMSGITVETK